MPTTATVTFDRIGRTRNVPPLTVTYDEGDLAAYEIAKQVFRYANPRLASRAVDVHVELGEEPGAGGNGVIYCGVQVGGSFEVSEGTVTA
jgi:hypothetical protein